MEKVIVIGANHAGTYAIRTLAENYGDSVSVTTYDRNDNISFLGCGMALWIGNVIDEPSGLFYATPEELESKGVSVFMKHDVEGVDFENKVVKVRDLATGELKEDSYDKLIIAIGSWPILPPLPGMDLENVVFAKIFQNAQDIIAKLKDKDIKRVAVVGAGYIGVELVEAFKQNGREAVLINDENVLNNYYDEDFQNMMRDRIGENGVELVLGEKVEEILGENGKVVGVRTDKGHEYQVDMVLMSIGFRANTKMFQGTDLELNPNGSIKVDNHQQTNIPGVYAIGDCADVENNATHERTSIMLATNAVRTGIVAGHNAAGNTAIEMLGVQGSNAIHVFGLTLGSTGITEGIAKKRGINYNTVTVDEWLRPEFMPDNAQVKLKIVWDKDTRRILGAQLASNEDITLAVHFFSLAIQEQYSIDKLALLDLFFLPHFNQPANFITKAGLLALGK